MVSSISKALPLLTALLLHPALAFPQETPETKYILERVEVQGNDKTHVDLILQDLLLKAGQVFDEALAEQSQFRLLSLGFFSRVNMYLKKGSSRGLVVLVVEVEERNTIVIEDIFMGVSGVTSFWGGADVSERNFLGRGMELGGAFVASIDQLGLRLQLRARNFLGSKLGFSVMVFYNDARDFFGGFGEGHRVLLPDEEGQTLSVDHLVVEYRRVGGILGLSGHLPASFVVYFDYRLEGLEATVPGGAIDCAWDDDKDVCLHGTSQALKPHILTGRSYLSTVAITFDRDTRSDPYMPQDGHRLNLALEVSSFALASRYDYARITCQFDQFWSPAPRHVLRLQALAGLVLGDAPFYARFFIGDLSDLVPSRNLELNFSAQKPPNVFGTIIEEERYGDLAARVHLEYSLTLLQGKGKTFYRLVFFGGVGILALARMEDLEVVKPSANLAPVPVDLTLDVGFRLDTAVGVFGLTIANLLALIPF